MALKERMVEYGIALTYPIINENTGQYLGLVGAAIPTISFFEHYGNIYEYKITISSSFG